MGCDVHSVLQKKVEDKWITIDLDMLQLPSSLARAFNEETESIRINGLPDDVKNSSLFYADGAATYCKNQFDSSEDYYLGEHSLGYFTLQDFLSIDIPEHTGFYIESTDGATVITINQTDPWDINMVIKNLQEAYILMYVDLTCYRLIVGYDS